MKRSGPLKRYTPLKNKKPLAPGKPFGHSGEPHPLLNRKPLRSKSAPRQRKPMKRANPANKAREFARCFHSEARVLFVQSLNCAACGRLPSQNAHVKSGGMGRREGFAWIVPLCEKCHTAQEGRTSAFERERRLPDGFLYATAAATERLWQAHAARSLPA